MRVLFICILSMILVTQAWSQNSGNDIVLMTNGDEKAGKVTEINQTNIKFVHDGETLSYTLNISDIIKITFSSGRIEFFNKPSQDNSSSVSNRTQNISSGKLMDHHNKVAILPFAYILNKAEAGEAMTYKVQNEAYSFLSKHVGFLKLQDPNTTNALLIKAGVNNDNIRGYTMGEVCDILGVEYVVQGTITQSETAVVTSSYQNSSYSRDQKNQNSQKHSIGLINAIKSSSSSSSSTAQRMNYETSITMNVFKENGDNIFSNDHTSIWNGDDAYKVTLKYLLKRIPLYRK